MKGAVQRNIISRQLHDKMSYLRLDRNGVNHPEDMNPDNFNFDFEHDLDKYDVAKYRENMFYCIKQLCPDAKIKNSNKHQVANIQLLKRIGQLELELAIIDEDIEMNYSSGVEDMELDREILLEENGLLGKENIKLAYDAKYYFDEREKYKARFGKIDSSAAKNE